MLVNYLNQDFVIFNNVTFWAHKNETNLNKFLKVIKKASLSAYIDSLPNKENEVLGNNGINLSGGKSSAFT